MTLLERNAAWWHALSVVVPEVKSIVGPGYLFPGPSFPLGPYDPGPVVFKLDAYNPRIPHQFFGTASYRVSGGYPLWTVEFEDANDGDFDDIIISVKAIPAPQSLELDCTPSTVVRRGPSFGEGCVLRHSARGAGGPLRCVYILDLTELLETPRQLVGRPDLPRRPLELH